MTMLVSIAIALLLCSSCVFGSRASTVVMGGDVILPAPTNGSSSAFKTSIGLIWVQGEGISAAQYIPIAKAFQQEMATNYNIGLCVGIPQYPGSSPEPLVIAAGIERVHAALLANTSLPSSAKFYAAAHSVGGVFLQMYVTSGGFMKKEFFNKPTFTGALRERAMKKGELLSEDLLRLQDRLRTSAALPATSSPVVKFEGFVFMGTFVLKENNRTWNHPTIHIAGEVDGLCRITRMAQAVVLQLQQHSNNNTQKYPVGVIDGVSHMQFASGTPPAFVKDADLVPFISYAEAHRRISKVAAAFLNNQVMTGATATTTKSEELISSWVKSSYDKYWTAILEGFELEGFLPLKPACYCNNPEKKPDVPDPFFGKFINYYPCLPGSVKPFQEPCRRGSRWSEKMQVYLGELSNTSMRFNVTSAFHPVGQTVPETNLAYVFNNCSKPTKDCLLQVTTVTNNKYVDDPLDTGFFPQTARQVEQKQLSMQRLLIAAGVANAQFNETDAVSLNRCGQINQKALDWAIAKAANHTIKRYESIGERMVMGNDINAEGGPFWIDAPLKMQSINITNEKTTKNETVYQVSSPSAALPYPFLVVQIEGFHYCKGLSPAAALEWILIDSLRLRNSLANHN